jgi:hypothetical protein
MAYFMGPKTPTCWYAGFTRSEEGWTVERTKAISREEVLGFLVAN